MEALKAYKKALAIKPDYAQAYYNMGNALQDQGKSDEAIASYKKALEIDPSFSEASSEMGECLLRVGKFEEGRSLIQKSDGSISL